LLLRTGTSRLLILFFQIIIPATRLLHPP
jgi:hypothetical protein